MLLQHVYDQLTVGELSQLKIGGRDNEDGICEADRPAVLNHIKLALTDLYTTFRLREDDINILLVADQLDYKLSNDFSVLNTETTETNLYITTAFDDTLLKVEEVFDDLGNLLTLNVRGDPCSLRTKTLSDLYIPQAVIDRSSLELPIASLKVVYRADHPDIDEDMGTYCADEVELELPRSHLKALLYNVASRVHNPIGLVQEFHSGNSYYSKYLEAVAKLKEHNYEIDNIGCELKFEQGGFV